MPAKLINTAIAMAMVSCAFAELVSDETVELAAASWLSSDRVAQMTMKGLSLDKLEHRGSLRVVHLSPSGYIVMSGSDISDPVISFSRNDFVDPEEGSPFHAMLEHSDSNVQKHEETGGMRAARWTELIGGRNGSKPRAMRLKATPVDGPSAVVIEPFMTTHWNQGTPWNDFCPLDNETNRCPCGCVATATAQQIAYSKWPWRTGRQDTWVHTLDTDGKQDDPDGPYSDTEVTVRFDGHEPFAWESLLDEYDGYWGDPRGRKSESERFAVARFVSWVDLITKMNFGKGGSGANFGNTGDSANDWYEMWEMQDLEKENPEAIAKIKADFEFGVPVHVGVPGHSVIGHGLAHDAESGACYLYLNYGWGGSADGWYELYGESSPIGGAFTGFRPKKMVQLETLPKVCDGEVEVKWHLPDCHANTVEGFELTRFTSNDELMDIVYDFQESAGAASNTNSIYVAKVDDVNNDSEMLVWENCAPGTYLFDRIATLTSSSMLEYRVQSSFAWDGRISVQASFDGGPWQTVSIPAMNRNIECFQWTTHRVFLGDHAGETIKLRLASTHSGGDWVRFDDFTISDVTGFTCEKLTASADARAHKFRGLAAGSTCCVAVKPLFPDGDGLLSEYETTRIAGAVRKCTPGGIVRYETNDMVYCSREIGDAWSITGSAEGETTIKGVNCWAGAFSVCLRGTVTAESRLSFDWFMRNCYDPSNGVVDELFATFVDSDGNYTDFLDIKNETLLGERQKVDVSLSRFVGKTGDIVVLFRHYANSWGGDDPIVRFYNPKVTNIAMPVYAEKPEWEVVSAAAMPTPEIVSVCGSDGLEIDEGIYRELQIGEDTLRVKCSQSVTSLNAYPSHLTYLADKNIAVEKSGPSEFIVKMDTSKAPRRQRMMLTLAATDVNGTTAYRDLSLRFDSPSVVVKGDWMRKVGFLAGAEPIAAFPFEGNMDNYGTGELISSIGGGGISYVESPLGFAIQHDDYDGPWTRLACNLPGNWTLLTIAKTSAANNAVLFHFGSSENAQSGLALASGGKDIVTLSHWLPNKAHTDRIVASVPGASDRYHAYAIRGQGRDIELFVDGTFAGRTTLPSLPRTGFQFFSVFQGNGATGLVDANGQCVDDWRMYDAALPDEVIGTYAAMLLRFGRGTGDGTSGDMEFPDGTTCIGDHALSGDGGLTRVTIPGSVTNIGAYAFFGCSGLKSVRFHGNAPVLGPCAFYEVPSDCIVYVVKESTGWDVEIPGTWNGLRIEYWQDVPPTVTYVVTYKPGSYGTGAQQTATKTKDVALTLKDAIFTRTGYTQTGWATRDGGAKAYNLGASYTTNVALTLYPFWTADTPPAPSPGTDPDPTPGTDPDPAPGADPDPEPGTDPDPAPGADPDPEPGTDPDPTPGTDPVARPELFEESQPISDPAAVFQAATIWDGWLESRGEVLGTIQAKVAKFTARGAPKVTVSVVEGGRKIGGRGQMEIGADGTVSASCALKDGRTVRLAFGPDELSGTLDGAEIRGARTIFTSRQAADKQTAEAVLARLQRTAVVYWGGNALSVVVVAKKGKCKVSGNLASGARVSASSQLVVGEAWCAVPVAYAKRGADVRFLLWMNRATGEIAAEGAGEGVKVQWASVPRETLRFRLDGAFDIPGATVLTQFLPAGEGLAFAGGTKWVLPKGGAVKQDRASGEYVDTKPETGNPSGLKLRYSPKTGAFKGSLKVHAVVNGKLKKYSASVAGIMVGDVGYGTATIKKFPSVEISVR